MRTAEDIVRDYRKRGYEDSRIRTLASSRSEPLRSEILGLLSDAEETEGVQQMLLPLDQSDIPTDELPPEGHLFVGPLQPADTPAQDAPTAIKTTVELPTQIDGFDIDNERIRLVVEDEIALKLDSVDQISGDCLEAQQDEIWLAEPVYLEPDSEETEEENPFGEGYIPPELTVLETVYVDDESSDGVIHFQPEYALSPEQREEALQQQQERIYTELAQMITANFEEYTRQLKAEESELVCEDFDDIARPASDPHTWKIHTEQEKAFDVLLDEYNQQQSLQNSLQMQLEEQSNSIAHTQQGIARLNELNAALSNENRLYLRDIEQFQQQLQGRNRAITEQSEEIIRLNGLVGQLSAAADEFMNQTRTLENVLWGKDELVVNLESLISLKSSEMDNLRDKLTIQNSKLEKLYEEKKLLEERAHGMDALQRELNILKTETIPNLNNDKEEMVELVGQELQKATELEEIASKRSRRLSYVMTFAAAACVMMVLSPVLAWHGREQDKLEQEAKFNSQMAQVQSVTDALQSERNQLRNRLQAVRAEFSQAQQEWQITKASLIQQARSNGADASMASNGGFSTPDPFNIPPRENIGNEYASNGDGSHINGFNINGWQNPDPSFAQNNNNDSATEEFKIAKVKHGEGLSQVLWRVYGNSSPQMIKYVSKLNKLKKDRRGNPLLQANQQLKLPQDIKTAMLSN